MNELFLTEESVYGKQLARLFKDSTNSYKYVFFLAVLNLIEKRTQSPMILTLQDVAIEAAAIAWYPRIYYRLSFGVQDVLGRKLDLLEFSTQKRSIANHDIQLKLRQAVKEQYESIKLDEFLRYVPYRFLSPFFRDRLRGVSDGQKNEMIKRYAAESFESNKPVPYRFLKLPDFSLELSDVWVRFLAQNLPIVRGWANGAWIDYLQRRNPNVPAIPHKIEAPASRTGLVKQAEYWKTVMVQQPIRCIYSGKLLEQEYFELDHLIPWSYVCHNQLWNLAPVLPEANSSKGNCLPAPKYLESFVQLQIDGLNASHNVMRPERWTRVTESFVSDLRVSRSDLLNVNLMKRAFEGSLPAMISLAEQIGFSTGWEYRG